jgi:hypothetical protein
VALFEFEYDSLGLTLDINSSARRYSTVGHEQTIKSRHFCTYIVREVFRFLDLEINPFVATSEGSLGLGVGCGGRVVGKGGGGRQTGSYRKNL